MQNYKNKRQKPEISPAFKCSHFQNVSYARQSTFFPSLSRLIVAVSSPFLIEISKN
jgi:hypothetical protein